LSRPSPTPNETPVKTFPTPSWGTETVIDELLVEVFEFNKPGFTKIPEGSAHENTRDFPNHKLLKEEYDGRYGLVRRYWCNGYRNEDQYNYDIAYSGESNSHPIFSRRYLVRRDTYFASAPLTKGEEFTGVYLIRITDAGSGYTPGSPPTVTISGGGGAGAAAQAIVSNDGTLSWIYLTAEGSGYTSNPTVTIGSGTATAVAITSLSTQVVTSVTITNGGTGYSASTTVTLTGGGGTGATAIAQVVGGVIKTVTITAYGRGYTSVPSVSFSGGGVNGAATAVLETITPSLVKEDVQQFPEDDPRRSLYVVVSRQWESLPGPVLIEHKFEPFINAYVTTLKRIVPNTSVPGDMYYVTTSEGQITEYSPLSFHRYIKSISKINPLIAWENGGADEEFEGTAPYSFPNEVPIAPTINVVYAYNGTTLDIAFGWRLNVVEGYSGPCPATFIRRYTFDPTDAAFLAALPQVTYIQPQADVIFAEFAYVGGNLIAQANNFVIPSSLHPELEINVITNGLGGGAPVVTIDTVEATVPPSLPPGTEIVASVSKPQRWLFGLFYVDIVMIRVPTPPP
jgi:hypothetical protein